MRRDPDPSTTSSTSTRPSVFRQRSSVGLGVVSGATGLLLLLSLARDWAHYPRPLFGAWVLLGLAVTWSLFVRPAVLMDAAGVRLRNVVRDVEIPWARLTGVESRWNLRVLVGDKGYTAWAISSQPERPRRASGAILAASTEPRVTAQSVARLIEAAKQEYEDAVGHGQLPASPDAVVAMRWVPLVIVLLLVPAVAVVAVYLF